MTVDSGIILRLRQKAGACDREICGALVGAMDTVSDAWPLSNFDPRKARFFIPATEVLRVEQEAEARGLRVYGFYHSHPNGSARPSHADLEWAVPGYIYLIIASSGAVGAWRLRDDRTAFTQIDLTT